MGLRRRLLIVQLISLLIVSLGGFCGWWISASIGHEATVSKVADDQIFYLMSRGLSEEEAMAMIVRGFIEPIAKELPMEYAVELNRLIELQMEGSIG